MSKPHSLRKATIVLLAALSGAGVSEVVRAGPRTNEWQEPYRLSKLEFLAVSATANSTSCARYRAVSRYCFDYQYMMAGPAKIVLGVFAPRDASLGDYEKTIDEAKRLLRVQAEGFFPGKPVPTFEIEVQRFEVKP